MTEYDGMSAPILTRTRSYTLGCEDDSGNIEYKRHLLTDDTSRIDKLTTQLSYRLHEGSGCCQYRIGVEDSGNLSCLSLDSLERSISMLEMMVESISAKVVNIERIEYRFSEETGEITTPEDKTTYFYALINIETCYDDDTSKIDVRIAVCGNVDAGKSTCIGVMKTGILDDGRGSARTTTMIHSHEIESGRTSTVSQHVIGFKNDGKITNYEQGSRQQSVDQITQQSVRLLTFIDLAGHEKYLRSMIYGVSSCLLDYALVLINARSGVTHMTHHHLTVCAMMNIPIIILFTKVDNCPQHRYKQTVDETRELLKAPDVRKRLQLINTAQAKDSDSVGEAKKKRCLSSSEPETERSEQEDGQNRTATAAAIALKSVLTSLTAAKQVGIPAFPISFVEGFNLEFLRRVCRFLPKRRKHSEKKSASLEYIIDRLYQVPGVGSVTYGFVNQGTITSNKTVWFGPLNSGSGKEASKGEFIRTTVKTVHYNQLPVKHVGAGNFCTLAIKLDKNQIRQVRRGQVIMETAPVAVMRFQAKINIIYAQSTTIKVGYTPFLHILMVRQSAIVEKIETVSRGGIIGKKVDDSEAAKNGGKEEILRPGDMSIITFRFSHRSEYIRENMRIMFRDGKVKGVGMIIATLDDQESPSPVAKGVLSTNALSPKRSSSGKV